METIVDKLAKRLQANWKTYVLPEAANEHDIVLHMLDDFWVAFEKSAYFLYKSCANSSPIVGRVNGNPLPLVLCVVPKDKLFLNPSKAKYKDSEFRQRIFSTNVRLSGYPKWRRDKIQDYFDCDPSLWYVELRDADFVK